MKKIRFLHAADLHLDSPFKGLEHLPGEMFQKIRKSTFRSLSKLIDAAIVHNVDFILLAGDLFDREQRSLYAQAMLRKELSRLQSADISVYIIHGNHDFLTGHDKSFTYSENVSIFAEEVESKPFIKEGEHLANIYGFSYNKRHLTKNMSRKYKKQNELVPFHIGMLHGNLSGREDHDPYAPFTVAELIDKELHYWALGHIHKQEVLHSNPPVVYSGNLQGRHKKEAGPKGCFLVELSEMESPKLEFLETSVIEWESHEVSIAGLNTLDELMDKMKSILEKTREVEKSKLISFQIVGSGELHNLLYENQLEDLMTLLNEGEEIKDNFLYVYTIKGKTMAQYSIDKLKEKNFYRDFFSIVENTDLKDEKFASLFRHSDARSFLEPFSETEKGEILEEAEKWLITKFLTIEKG
ncbi:metallophosphoesterase family protein [Sutcliffiella rhizosphaerae]|uniref:Metallophosphoesterase YhaO n=1 Tax=Sutcliffiella rhizosphaerae TaxID=2880967 RepID=A0ABN8ABG3_9BACI|nr:DNA repair exonuclease [Sutcliffiella rhizosphaerae]CAG9622545.1 putative metallophosphoesterase YhaO [Sutcliffiella rhizosphaerae]